MTVLGCGMFTWIIFTMKDTRSSHKIVVGEPEEKRSL
jgi:hypothetical protein